MVGDFAGHQFLVLQHHLGLQHGGTINPVHHAVTAYLRDKGGEVVGGDGKTFRIIGDAALTGAMLIDQSLKLLEE